MPTSCPHCQMPVSGQVAMQTVPLSAPQAPVAEQSGKLSSGCVIVICVAVLIGLLTVAGVVALAIIASRFVTIRRDAEIDSAKTQIRMLEEAIEMYRVDTGQYPLDDEGLLALRHQPPSAPANKWRGPYITSETPLDPWGNYYRYEQIRDSKNLPSFEVVSDGPDGASGTADDIRIPK